MEQHREAESPFCFPAEHSLFGMVLEWAGGRLLDERLLSELGCEWERGVYHRPPTGLSLVL